MASVFEQEKASLSPRGRAAIRELSIYQQDLTSLAPSTINLATADNVLGVPCVKSLLNAAPPIPPGNLTYTAMYGSPETRTSLASFLSQYLFRPYVSAKNLTITPGAFVALDALTFALADPEDAVLTPSPCYRGQHSFPSMLSSVRLVTAPFDTQFPPAASVSALDKAWNDAGAKISGIRFLLLVNPENSTGVVYPSTFMRDAIVWARQRDLHIVVDESSALSVHRPETPFNSIFQILDGDLRDDVHVVWEVSRDLCLPGLRLGVILTHNQELLNVLHTNLAYFHSCSRLAQWDFSAISTKLGDFFTSNRALLRMAYTRCRKKLDEMHVRVADSEAGFVIWADFTPWTDGTRESEMALWRKLRDAGVLILPGSELAASKYGFFRICFASVQVEILDQGLDRIQRSLDQLGIAA